MKKPRIFIAIHYMELGGAEISLLGLLNALDTQRCDVDLFVYSHRGELMELIPDKINLLPEMKEYAHIESPMLSCLKNGCWKVFWKRLVSKVIYIRYVRKHHPSDGSAIFQILADEVTPVLPSLSSFAEYDLAINFMGMHNVVLEKVQAKRKIAWIHTDYSQVDVEVKREFAVWSRFDNVVSISEQVTQTFLQRFPTLKDKIILIENILSPDFVRQRSKAFVFHYPHSDAFNLLSVGRFSYAKNFDNIPVICKGLRKAGINAYWYLIGYGTDEAKIRQKIKEAGMQDYVVILGKQSNPYPYMAACDLYVQPSRFEGKSVTVREAQILGKVVVVTDYPTAKSQVLNGDDGIIVPLENEGCARGIVDLVHNKSLQEHIVDYLHCHDYGNEKEVEKVYQLVNDQ